MIALPKFLLHILTETDNKTFCPIRIIAVAGCVEFFVLVGMNYYQHHIFDPQAYALGLGGLLAGVGAALKLKPENNGNGQG